MDWHVQPLSRRSTFSQVSFQPGDRVCSYIFKDDADNLQRMDVLETEARTPFFTKPEHLLGRWTHVIKPAEEDQKGAQKSFLAASEELFLSLFDSEKNEKTSTYPEHNALQQLLGLLLERKRILKRLTSGKENPQRYLHVASQRELSFEVIPLDSELVVKVKEQMDRLLTQ